MSVLDNLEKIKKIDQKNLADLISKIPEQLEKVWQEKEKINAPLSFKKVKNILICGMGCDRVVGELIKKTLEEKILIPIEIKGDYQIPSYLNQETLVILLSYSGETKEILSFLREILNLKREIKIFIISGGGELIKIAREKKIPFYQFEGKGPSRANVGYLFFSLIILLKKLDLIKIDDEDLIFLIKLAKEFNQSLKVKRKTEENVAKYLAYQIFDRLPLIVGASHLWPIAQRWKKDLNENAKTFAIAEESPEFFHNTVVGIEFPWRIRDEVFFLFLESEFYQEEIKKALTIFKEILKKEEINFETVPLIGKNKLTEVITGLLLGDWLSFYLAILNEIDPTVIENIEIIKKKLKEK